MYAEVILACVAEEHEQQRTLVGQNCKLLDVSASQHGQPPACDGAGLVCKRIPGHPLADDPGFSELHLCAESLVIW